MTRSPAQLNMLGCIRAVSNEISGVEAVVCVCVLICEIRCVILSPMCAISISIGVRCTKSEM